MSASWFFAYPILAGCGCLLAIAMVLRTPDRFSLTSQHYRRFLFQRWKVITFAVAALIMVGVAPYSGDPTWDYYDAALMSALTFWTAPWSIGTLVRLFRRQTTPSQAYVALCCWLFSAGLSYDYYLWLRDSSYPDTWLANLGASSGLYISAGLLWNLQRRHPALVHFAFLDLDWPRADARSRFLAVLPFALLFMLLVGLLLSPFLVNAVANILPHRTQ